MSLSVFLLASCSLLERLKHSLPDKEKDYHYSTEIPDLIVPPDLSNSTIEYKVAKAGLDYDAAPKQAGNLDADKNKQPAEQQVSLVSYTAGPPRLKINEPIERAWRIVGKALTRKSMEVVDRNRGDGVYFIQYDPNEKDIEDGSIWDELVFLFGDDQSNEEEYQIRLVENNNHTEVLVLDKQGTPLANDVGMNLLNLLLETIKQDFADDE